MSSSHTARRRGLATSAGLPYSSLVPRLEGIQHPPHVSSAKITLSKSLHGKCGEHEVPPSIRPARTVALVSISAWAADVLLSLRRTEVEWWPVLSPKLTCLACRRTGLSSRLKFSSRHGKTWRAEAKFKPRVSEAHGSNSDCWDWL